MRMGVLVHLGSLGRVPWIEGHINNRNFLLTVLEAGQGQGQGSGRWVVWWGPTPWFVDSYLCCIFTWWEGEGSPWGLFYKGTCPIHGGHYPHDPAISHWALGFSMNFGGAQTFRPRQRGLLVLKMEPKQIYINSQPINSHRCPYKSPRALDINLKWWLSDKTLLGKGCVEWRTGPLNPRYPDSENTGRREGREISLPFLLNF